MTPCRGRPCPQEERLPILECVGPRLRHLATSRPRDVRIGHGASGHAPVTGEHQCPVAGAASSPSRGVAVFAGHDQHAEHRAAWDGFGVGLFQPVGDDLRAGLCSRRGRLDLGNDQRAAADGEVVSRLPVRARRSQSHLSSTRKRRRQSSSGADVPVVGSSVCSSRGLARRWCRGGAAPDAGAQVMPLAGQTASPRPGSRPSRAAVTGVQGGAVGAAAAPPHVVGAVGPRGGFEVGVGAQRPVVPGHQNMTA